MSRRRKDPLRTLTDAEHQTLTQLSRSQVASAVQVACQRILQEVDREPTPEADGTATWSLGTLKKSLRTAPDGLPRIATSTIWQVLHEAGRSYQKSRTWCPTGSALRKRKSGTALVTDPDAESKKS
jgi:transposase